MRKWFNKHRHGIETALNVLIIVVGCIDIGLSVVNAVINILTGKTNTLLIVLFYALFLAVLMFEVLYAIVHRYNKKHDRRKIYSHNIAANSLDVVEDVLDEYDITIPDKAREGGEGEARLYGEIYDRMLYLMEISVIATLQSINGVECELITDFFEGCEPPNG